MTEPEVPISSGGAVLGTNRRSKRIGKRKEDLKTGIFFNAEQSKNLTITIRQFHSIN